MLQSFSVGPMSVCDQGWALNLVSTLRLLANDPCGMHCVAKNWLAVGELVLPGLKLMGKLVGSATISADTRRSMAGMEPQSVRPRPLLKSLSVGIPTILFVEVLGGLGLHVVYLKATFICDECLAVQCFPKAPPELNFTNVADDAPWVRTIFTTAQYLAAEPTPTPWRHMCGWNLELNFRDGPRKR
jgi:hypothetical protein